MPRDSLLSLLQDFALFSKDTAIVERRGYRRETWTYKKLMTMAVGFALHLRSQGIHSNDRVMLWAPNSGKWVAAFWGCLLRGAVAVPLDDACNPEFATRVAKEADVKFALLSRSKQPLLPAVPSLVLEDFPGTPTAPAAPKYDVPPSSGHRQVRLLLSASPIADEPITRDHIAEILFTSGTTSEPRGVVLTHGNFLANLEPVEAGIEP